MSSLGSANKYVGMVYCFLTTAMMGMFKVVMDVLPSAKGRHSTNASVEIPLIPLPAST